MGKFRNIFKSGNISDNWLLDYPANVLKDSLTQYELYIRRITRFNFKI